MIKAVIFDMDGVLIDSEPLWKKAEIKVFKTVGLNLTTDMVLKTTGLDTMSTVKHWYSFQSWKNKSLKEVADEIILEVLALIQSDGLMKDGVLEILDFIKQKNLLVALASSSEMKIINTVLEKLKLKDKFAAVYSSEFEEYGKPHPGVYLSAAKLLNTNPVNCLVFEDSFYGSLSAKSARMKVVTILGNDEYNSTVFDFTDLKIKSFNEFTDKEYNYLNTKL